LTFAAPPFAYFANAQFLDRLFFEQAGEEALHNTGCSYPLIFYKPIQNKLAQPINSAPHYRRIIRRTVAIKEAQL
jgi:hypothetical protein